MMSVMIVIQLTHIITITTTHIILMTQQITEVEMILMTPVVAIVGEEGETESE